MAAALVQRPQPADAVAAHVPGSIPVEDRLPVALWAGRVPVVPVSITPGPAGVYGGWVYVVVPASDAPQMAPGFLLARFGTSHSPASSVAPVRTAWRGARSTERGR
jgi:hypothetical protein